VNSQPPSSGLRIDPVCKEDAAPPPTVVAISSDAMGRGDDELGQVLLRTYLHTLGEVTPRPDTIVFLNSGVTLAVEGSQALDDLRALADQGVQILLCGTCVGHFDLNEKVVVGEISNMYAISEAMLRAGKVINL
jgi:selenium metabolism protein YedF